MGMFDFNEDGKTDIGEQFIGYQIYKDVTGDDASSDGEDGGTDGDASGGNGSFKIPAPRVGGKKLDGFTIFLIVLFGYAILSAIAKLTHWVLRSPPDFRPSST
jgi:hypothetical protein